MERKCHGFEVFTNKGGDISIAQHDHDDMFVQISPEQIETLYSWLKECAAEISASEGGVDAVGQD